MLAPLVVVLIVTVTEPAKLPPAGLKVGDATVCEIVYLALVTLLLLIPLAAAIALRVVVVVTVSGPVSTLDTVVLSLHAALPILLAPLVVVLIVTVTEPAKVPPGGVKV